MSDTPSDDLHIDISNHLAAASEAINAEHTRAGHFDHRFQASMHVDIAQVRATQAVAKAIRDRLRSSWDENTASEADAFQELVMTVLGVSARDYSKLASGEGYPHTQKADIVNRVVDVEQNGIDAAEVEEICQALCEVGGWSEIDGDGTNASLIIDHIRRLAPKDECGHGTKIGDGIIVEVSHAGAKRHMVLLDHMEPGTHGVQVNIHTKRPGT